MEIFSREIFFFFWEGEDTIHQGSLIEDRSCKDERRGGNSAGAKFLSQEHA